MTSEKQSRSQTINKQSKLEQARAEQASQTINLSEELTQQDHEAFERLASQFSADKTAVMTRPRTMRAHFQDDMGSTLNEAIASAKNKGREALESGGTTGALIGTGLGLLYLSAGAGLAQTDLDQMDATSADLAGSDSAQALMGELELQADEAVQVDIESFGPMEDNALEGYEFDIEGGETTGDVPISEAAEALDRGEMKLQSFLSNPAVPGQIKAAVLYETDAVDSNDSFEKPRLDVAKQLAQGDIATARALIDDKKQAFQNTKLDDWVRALEQEFGPEIEMAEQDQQLDGQAIEEELGEYEAGQSFVHEGAEYLSISEPVLTKEEAQNHAEAQGVSGVNIEAPAVQVDGTTYYVPAVDYNDKQRITFEQARNGIVLDFPDGGKVRATFELFDKSDKYDLIRNAEMQPVGVYDSEYDVLLLPKKETS